MESIHSTGEKAPPFLILEGKVYLQKWFVKSVNLPPGTTIGLNNSGYIDDQLSMEFIKHFDQHTKNSTTGKWRLLLSDGHGAHEHYDFLEYCYTHHIISYSLSPHTTHLMQSLDVACFQPLKHYHRQSIDQAVMLEATKFPVTEFFCIYNEIHERVFTSSTILSAFRKTRIHPFNPEKVIASLRIRQEMAAAARKAISFFTSPLASSPLMSPSKYTTPHKVSEIDAMQTHL